MNNPLTISVITVCYNSGKTLERALQSVKNQDWPCIEHIVIDGGSTDSSLNILRAYEAHLSCIVSEADEGIYDAMNKGLARATGDVVCFLNSDDQYVDTNVLTRVIERMRSNCLDVLFGDVVFFNKSNPHKIIRRYRSGAFNLNRLSWGWMPAHPSLFMRREIFQKIGGFKSGYRIAGDFELVARAFARMRLRFEYSGEVLVRMQTGGASTASGFKGRIRHNQELLRACRENGIKTNIFKLLSRYPVKFFEWL